MDKLTMKVREHKKDLLDALNIIDNGSYDDKQKALSSLDNLFAGVTALDWQVKDDESETAKEELKELMNVFKRAKVIRKREKDKDYQKRKIKQVKINLNVDTDSDIIEILESKDNVQGYIKDVIRKDAGTDYETN